MLNQMLMGDTVLVDPPQKLDTYRCTVHRAAKEIGMKFLTSDIDGQVMVTRVG
jgi:hypothetical protein